MQLTKTEYKNLTFYTRPRSDKFIIQEVLEDNYKYITEEDIKDIDTIVDIGAHIGVFSIFYSSFVNKIYSYEPFDENYFILQKNIEINEIKNINSFNIAVSKSSEDRLFYQSQETNARHTLLEPPFLSVYLNQKPYKIVKCTTLEEIINTNKIDKSTLLKIDCEGSEYDIILNAKKELFDNIKLILIETHQDNKYKYTYEDLIKKLKEIGFSVKYIPYFQENEFIAGNIIARKE